nr:MAG TPA: hypothetical protein [Caudoviricetes sp.]
MTKFSHSVGVSFCMIKHDRKNRHAERGRKTWD